MLKLGKISLVLPVYNEVVILQQVLDKYLADLAKCGVKYEIIAVNDGCTDGSDEVLKGIAKNNRSFRIVNLEGRSGKQAAINAGMELTDPQSDAVIIADIDVLNPVGIIQTIKGRLEEGHPIVYARRHLRGFHKIKLALSDIVVKVGAKFFGIDGNYTGKSNIMAFTRPVADVIVALPERNKYLRTMDTWLGWDIDYVLYPSGYNRVEEKNLHKKIKTETANLPNVKGTRPRDTAREHSGSKIAFIGFGIAALVALMFGVIYLLDKTGDKLWVHLMLWAIFAFCGLMSMIFFVQSVLIKRVGIIHGKTAVTYKVVNIIN